MIDIKRPIAELVEEIKSGKLTAVELVEQCLLEIKKTKSYHAILEVNPAVLERAREIDLLIKDKRLKIKDLRLLGMPFIAKDNFLTRGTHTTASSNILKSFKAPYQATVIEKLEAEGAIMIAKANLDAFGHGSSTENSDFGPTKNPMDPSRVAGGSSGGSAAAVALGLACFAIGTDTGSSVRLPASFCGVVGYMPSYGLVSRYGVVAMGSSFDTMGAMANRVEDAALILDITAGKDPLDATTVERKEAYSLQRSTFNIEGLKVGVIKEYLAEGIEPGVKSIILAAADKMKIAGAEVEEVSIPHLDLALAAYYVLVPAEISSNLSRYDGIRYGHSLSEARNLSEMYLLSRSEGFGDEAKRRIMIGTYVLSSGYYDAYYKRAQKVRTLLIREFKKAFEKYDVLIGPVAPMPAFKLGERTADPLQMYLVDKCTTVVNLVGSCGISVPAGEAEGLPVGLQIIGPQGGEQTMLEVAQTVEALL